MLFSPVVYPPFLWRTCPPSLWRIYAGFFVRLCGGKTPLWIAAKGCSCRQ